MHSCAWMNGQYRQVGPPSQSSQAATQLTYDTMRNQQAGTANNSCQYRTPNTGARPPQSAHFTFCNGAWQNSAVPHQAVSSQQPAGGKTSNYYLKMLLHLQNTQSGNPLLPVTNGLQDATQQDFHQNSAQNPSTHSPPNMMKANTTYPLQDMSAHWNQQVTVHGKQSVGTQDGNIVSDLQHHRVQKSLLQNVNGEQTKPVSAYTTTATSLPHEQVVCTSTLVSATGHNRQTAHNQHHRQNGTQHGFAPSILPSYNMSVSQSFRNNSITTNSSSSEHILQHVSSMSQKTQQYPTQLNSTRNNGEEATSSINSNSYNRQYETSPFLSKTNEFHLNPAAEIQEQMLSRQMIARIADDLRKSFTAGSDDRPPVYTSPPYRGKQFVSEVRMTESNQNMQPVTLTVAENYNSNVSQSLPLNSGQSLPQTTHGVMSRTQHSVDVPPQQSSVPNVFYVTATGDGSGNGGNAANASFPKSNMVSKGNLAGSLSDASQLMKLPESISPQRNKTESSVANNREMLGMLSSVKESDSSIHSSPGRTGTRVVAVVQPLSQENYQVASKHTSSNTVSQSGERTATEESLSNREKLFISPAVAKNKQAAYLREASNLYPENPNHMRSNKSIIRHSAASNDGTFVSSSDSAGPQEKQLCADDTGSELAITMQVDQCVAPTAQQSVTSEVPVSQSGDEDKSEMPTDPKAEVFELSSVPTMPWTAVPLTNLILYVEKKAQMTLKDSANFDSARKILNMFWDGNCKKLACNLKTGWYKDLITDVNKFCNKHVTSDSVILSHVKPSVRKQLKSYHVLKDDEVYSELPYKSSWLNVNEQLDDIDKEFGFLWFLKHRLDMLESHSQPDQVGTVNSICAQIVSEVPNKVLSQTELEPVDSGEEKQASTVEATSTQTTSPNKTESADSSDPYCSLQIQVMSPEEAKVIFEQVQSKMPQSMDTDSQPESVMNISGEGEVREAIDVTLNDSKLENESVCPIEQVCCTARWKEIIYGSNTPSLSKCQCKYEQSHKDCTDKTLDKEEVAVQKEDKLCAIRSDSKFHSATEGENQAKSGEDVKNPIMTHSWSELCNELSQTIALTEDDDKSHSYSDKETKDISHISIDSSQSSIILISENKDEDLSSSLTEIQSDPEMDCVQDQLKSTGSTQSCTAVSSDKEIENLPSSESEVASQMSDLEENCGQAQLTSPDVAESSLETEEEQTQISATAALQTPFSLSGKHETVERKWKRLSSHDRFFPFLKRSNKCKPPVDVDSQPVLEGVSKCRKVLVDATDIEPLASNVRTVELVLFGSAPQDKCVLLGGRKKHISSPGAVSDAVQMPPKVLSVILSPLRRKSSETVPTGEYSVKRWIHEKWRRSFPPTKIRRRSKLKTWKCTFASLSGGSLKKAETVGPTNAKELPVPSEMRIWNRNTKRCLSLKRRRSLSNGLKRGDEKTKTDAVTLKQPADQERSNAENGSHVVMPLQENDVLRFSVLPNTFNFKDGSNGREETNDPVPNKPDPVEGKDMSPSKTVTREIGTWYPNPEKKYCPLRSPPVPKTSSLFLAFQKKYMEKTQPSTDE